jgi:hypothetical protein
MLLRSPHPNFDALILPTVREQNAVRGILRLNGMDGECRGHPLPPRAQRPNEKTVTPFALILRTAYANLV